MQAINKAGCVLKFISQLTEICGCYVLMYKSGFLEALRWWRGSILGLQRNPDLQGFCSLVVNQIGVNLIPPKFDTLFVTSLEVIQQFKGLTV